MVSPKVTRDTVDKGSTGSCCFGGRTPGRFILAIDSRIEPLVMLPTIGGYRVGSRPEGVQTAVSDISHHYESSFENLCEKIVRIVQIVGIIIIIVRIGRAGEIALGRF